MDYQYKESYERILEIYRKYLEVVGLSMVYHQRMLLFFKYLYKKDIPFGDINKTHIYDFIYDRKYSINSINTLIKAGKHFYNYLNNTGMVNPFSTLKLLPVERKIPQYVSEDELLYGVRYVISASTRICPLKAMALLYFMFFTGLRRGEIITLKRKEIDITSDPITAHVRLPSKNKRERIVCFPKRHKQVLVDYFNSEEEDINAFNVERWNIEYLAKLFCKAFPNKHITPHTFRHSFAKHLIRNKIDVSIVSKLLGHANIETTLIYVNPDEEMIKDFYKEGTA